MYAKETYMNKTTVSKAIYTANKSGNVLEGYVLFKTIDGILKRKHLKQDFKI